MRREPVPDENEFLSLALPFEVLEIADHVWRLHGTTLDHGIEGRRAAKLRIGHNGCGDGDVFPSSRRPDDGRLSLPGPRLPDVRTVRKARFIEEA